MESYRDALSPLYLAVKIEEKKKVIAGLATEQGQPSTVASLESLREMGEV